MHSSRSQFLVWATLFQVALTTLGFVLAWLLQINPFDHFEVSGTAVLTGVVGAVPMLILFAITYRFPVGPLKEIKTCLIEVLGPYLADCRWYDLTCLSMLVGFSEELLFRAVLQPSLNHWGPVVGLVASNILFGLAHAVTPMYVVLAGLLGAYLGAVFQFAAHGNLLVTSLMHGLYDLIAFLIVRRSYLSRFGSEVVPEPISAE